ncbi:MAG: hypothetical protein U5K33_07675 [Halofilum sp. (in: g-proteobacteria)]|nr:hypothetical protein [Halofilum sp. (in: g-proteobacteria)]
MARDIAVAGIAMHDSQRERLGASFTWRCRDEAVRSFFSSTAMLSPVSIAVELATVRRMADRETRLPDLRA